LSSCIHWQWEKRDKNTAAAPRVSQSLSHSVNQPPITSLPEHCNHLHKQHPQSSIIRANHASRWLVYVQMQMPCSRRACTKSSSASRSPHISLHHTARTVTIIINNIHNHQSFEPIMHPGGWCTYASCRVPGQRARSHRQRRALRIYRSTTLHERINSKSSTPQMNHTNDNPIQSTSTRASSSKWQCQRKGGAPNHSHTNLPQTDARKVSNRIDDAIRAKPRSPEATKGIRGVQ
jgi:hypothetical protein